MIILRKQKNSDIKSKILSAYDLKTFLDFF